ncbi:hypothetical protein ACSAZK_06455 [Methanosarcina sp. Mfa9]|uniref:hypothetical protein n=1 Tax=Methanosarcina sp. Mfa9 TaxID=3439063 RepID=UPI003F8778A6
MFAEGNIECVEKLLKPAKRVLKVGMPVKHDAFERRVDLWNKIRMNYDSYLDEECGTFLKDLDQHFCSLFDGSLLVLAASFRENGEFFGAANIFSAEEVELYRRIERYNLFEILSADDIRKKLIQKDDKVLELLRDYYVSMDSWVGEQLDDPSLRLTLRYYLKKKWDGYKEKLNTAVSSSVLELDWLKSLIKSWESATDAKVEASTKEIGAEKERAEAERELAEAELAKLGTEKALAEESLRQAEAEKARASEQIRGLASEREAAESRLREMQAERSGSEEQIKALESEKAKVEEQIQALAAEKGLAEKQASEMAADKAKVEEKFRRLSEEKALMEGKGSRYVKLEEVKQYELNFIGRVEHKLGNSVTLGGKNYKVDSSREIKQVDTSSFAESFGLSERDLKNLPENRALLASFVEKKLLGKKQRYALKALFSARVERYAESGYDTDPLELKDVNAYLVDARDEAREKGESALLCLASPTGFEDTISSYISSDDFHRNFLSKYLSVCLLDLETGKQLYNPHDTLAKEFAGICEMETETEKSEKLNLEVRKAIEDGLLVKDYVVFGDLMKSFGNTPALKSLFYDYADEGGLKIQFVEDVGLVLMREGA